MARAAPATRRSRMIGAVLSSSPGSHDFFVISEFEGLRNGSTPVFKDGTPLPRTSDRMYIVWLTVYILHMVPYSSLWIVRCIDTVVSTHEQYALRWAWGEQPRVLQGERAGPPQPFRKAMPAMPHTCKCSK